MRRSGFPAKPAATLRLARLFAFLLASCFVSSAVHAQTTGLVAAYSFEEGTGTTTADASGGNNTGHAGQRNLDEFRQVRQGADFQWHDERRQRCGRSIPSPDHRHDSRGMGLSHDRGQCPGARS